MKKFIFSIYAAMLISLSSSAQELRACDLLNGKGYKELYQQADFVCLARVISVEEGLNGSKYFNVKLRKSYKGIPFFLGFNQLASEQFFPFRKDSSYVFFVFKRFEDSVFMPCLYFGVPQKMPAFILWTDTLCKSSTPFVYGQCPKAYSPVCSCDGQTYANECEAKAAGVLHWILGECEDFKRK